MNLIVILKVFTIKASVTFSRFHVLENYRDHGTEIDTLSLPPKRDKAVHVRTVIHIDSYKAVDNVSQ